MFSATVHHAALWAFIVSMIPKFFRNRIFEVLPLFRGQKSIQKSDPWQDNTDSRTGQSLRQRCFKHNVTAIDRRAPLLLRLIKELP